MLGIKRLYTFLIQSFVPVFAMTFGICLFILLMQFLWRFVEDLVGKGLDTVVLAELFFYAALQLVPMSLPLALLLASLMTFGNLGERLELLAIKASGVSLLKSMRPLIFLVAAISIGAFFFQNEVMPRVQVKLRALTISIKQKSPELDIPEGSFYTDIPNYNLYVNKKVGKSLYDVIIYDTSKGFDNMAVIVCDSALMQVSEDKKFLLFTLFSGQQFANFEQNEVKSTSRRQSREQVQYSRENFTKKDVIITFDTGFDRMDESNLEGTQIAKNISMLQHSIDSMNFRLDSINVQDRKTILKHTYLTYRHLEEQTPPNTINGANIKSETVVSEPEEAITEPEKEVVKLSFDSLLNSLNRDEYSQYLSSAISEAENNNFNFIEVNQKSNLQRNIRLHQVEWYRKFTLSFACLIFFFIGAPLGAIIRKGGLGMPVVISVLLFIIYYIIDNIGYKFARDGVWEAWQGMWLSSAVLFPLGVFLTYKAMNDSALFNVEAYGKFLRKILYIKTPEKSSYQERQEIIERIPKVSDLNVSKEVVASLQSMDSDVLRDILQNHKKYNYDRSMRFVAISILKERGAEIGDMIDKQDYKYSKAIYKHYKDSSLLTMIAYCISLLFLILNVTDFSRILDFAYLVLFIRSMMYYFLFYKNTEKKSMVYSILSTILSFACYPIAYLYNTKQMSKVLNNFEEDISELKVEED